MRRYWALFATYLRPIWPRVMVLAALIVTGIALQLINPQLIRWFIDTAATTNDVEPLLMAAVLFLGISLLIQVAGIAAVYVGEDVGWKATNQLRSDLARHCLRLDMAFHSAHSPGEMIERIDGDILTMANFFSRFVVSILGNVLLLAGVLVVLAYQDWRIPLALAAYVGLGFAGLFCLRQFAVPSWKATRQASADLFGFIEEQLSSTEDIRSSGAVAYVMRNLFKFNKAYLDTELRSATANTFIMAVWVSLYIIGQAVALVSSYYLLRGGFITIGAIYLVIYYTHLAFLRLAEIAEQIQDLQRAAASVARVEALLAEKSNLRGTPTPTPLPRGPLAIAFDDVTFGYDEGEPVLRNVAFQLQPGKTLGLLGRTGSGKTTIARLLFRFYDPTQGAIRLGPAGDIRDVALDELRQRIGMVTQQVQLFNASVRDNVTFFDKRISDQQILRVIAELGLLDWYDALPEGLDTRLETAGGNLSAGEAQLLAFARVFLKDPSVVILDEASSRLDPATEKLIERAMDRLLENRTGIIIAHHLNTVLRADQIMIVEGGRIEEFGDYAALARDPSSRFYHLLQTGLEEVLA